MSEAGAVILAAYAANQMLIIGPSDLSYTLFNLVGSAILSVAAIVEQQWGFLLLEGVWALVSLVAALRLVMGRRTLNNR